MGSARDRGWRQPERTLDGDLAGGRAAWNWGGLPDADLPARRSASGTIDIRELTLRYQQELAGAPVDPRRHVSLDAEPAPQKPNNAALLVAIAALAAVAALAAALVLLAARTRALTGAAAVSVSAPPAEQLQATAVEDEAPIPSATVYVFDPVPIDRAKVDTGADRVAAKATKARKRRPRARRARRAPPQTSAPPAKLAVTTKTEAPPQATSPPPEAIAAAPVAPEAPPEAVAAASAATAAPKACDEIECALDPSLSCCPTPDVVAAKPALPERPSAADVRSSMGKVRGRIASCGDKHATRSAVIIVFKIGRDGLVEHVKVPRASGALAGCLQRAMSKARFPESRQGLSTRYPVSFRHF